MYQSKWRSIRHRFQATFWQHNTHIRTALPWWIREHWTWQVGSLSFSHSGDLSPSKSHKYFLFDFCRANLTKSLTQSPVISQHRWQWSQYGERAETNRGQASRILFLNGLQEFSRSNGRMEYDHRNMRFSRFPWFWITHKTPLSLIFDQDASVVDGVASIFMIANQVRLARVAFENYSWREGGEGEGERIDWSSRIYPKNNQLIFNTNPMECCVMLVGQFVIKSATSNVDWFVRLFETFPLCSAWTIGCLFLIVTRMEMNQIRVNQ